jgi:protein subunit release factor B
MYTRWCEKKGFKIEVLDYQTGDEAGIKSVSFMVKGINAYGLLKIRIIIILIKILLEKNPYGKMLNGAKEKKIIMQKEKTPVMSGFLQKMMGKPI